MMKNIMHTLVIFFMYMTFPAASAVTESPDGLKDKILEPGFRLLLIGPYGGIDYNMHRGKFSTTDGHFTCCNFDEGTGIAPVFGAKLFYPLTDEISLSPRVAYEGRGGEFTQTRNDIPILGSGNQIEYWNVEEKLKTKLNTLTLEVLGTYTLTSFGLYVAAGPSVGFLLSKNFETTESILGPPGVTYIGGGTTKAFPDQITDINSTLISIRGGIGALIPVSNMIYLNPEALYSYPFNKVAKGYDWKASALQATLGILFMI